MQMMGGYGYSSECDLNCKNTPAVDDPMRDRRAGA
jgi:hypothetical protein